MRDLPQDAFDRRLLFAVFYCGNEVLAGELCAFISGKMRI